MLWNVGSDELDVLVTPPQSEGFRDYTTLKPETTIKSAGLCRGLFEVFLGAWQLLSFISILHWMAREQALYAVKTTLCLQLCKQTHNHPIVMPMTAGEASVVPLARAEWAKGARLLLESEIVRRENRQGGDEETSLLP